MVEKLNKNLIAVAIVIAGGLIAGAVIYTSQEKMEKEGPAALVKPAISEEKSLTEKPSELDSTILETFAKCLTKKGAKFYGAFWCGWCKRQKQLFGETAKYLPYIECSDPKTRQLNDICKKAGIRGFPTWEFNGKKSSGFKTLEELAELSGCKL